MKEAEKNEGSITSSFPNQNLESILASLSDELFVKRYNRRAKRRAMNTCGNTPDMLAITTFRRFIDPVIGLGEEINGRNQQQQRVVCEGA